MSKNLSDKYLTDKLGLDDLSNGISIYGAENIFYVKHNDLDKIDTNLDTFIDFSENIDYGRCVENCSTCYFRHNEWCFSKNIDISDPDDYPIDCWQYKNSITMRTYSDFQDDYDNIYDDFD
nr:MAG TPA: hypothetical protein [Caudoviricetes sp.]